MARIEGTGIKTPSKKASRMAGKVASSMSAGSYGGYVDAGDARGFVSPEQADRMLKNPEAYKMRPSETRYLRESMGLPRAQAPTETFERRDFFSMKTDPRNEVKVAQAGASFTNPIPEKKVQPLSPIGSEAYKREVEGFVKEMKDSDSYRRRFDPTTGREIDEQTRKEIPGGEIYGEKQLKESYPFRREMRYEFNPLKYEQGVPYGKKEEKPSFLERATNIAGGIFNRITGTQSAEASQIGGSLPSGTQFSPSGDTSFASYRMAGGGQQQQGSGIVTPFSQTSMGKGEPRNITKFQDTSMGRKTATVDGQQVAKRQTVASLPSNYKQTEAESFRKTTAFKEAQGIAKRNPNVSVGVDSKGQPRATATNNTGVARAQAMAVNRKLSGTRPKSAKQRAQDAAKARRAAGPNRKMSDGQQTRAQAGASARTAQGNRARVKANARKRAQAAAKRRRAKKKGKK